MTTVANAAWERHDDGQYISVPIRCADLDEVREWCAKNCLGDFAIVLGRRVLFQSRENAALATLWCVARTSMLGPYADHCEARWCGLAGMPGHVGGLVAARYL